MDLNYILSREQHALHMAATSRSASARVAHRAFAKAYGLIIAASGFPHRDYNNRGPDQTAAAGDDGEHDNLKSESGSAGDPGAQRGLRSRTTAAEIVGS